MSSSGPQAQHGASSTAAHAAAERREAARALLQRPLLTVAGHPQELDLVHRHHAALAGTFNRLLGYRLIVESGFARLVKAPIGREGPVRAVRATVRGPALDGPALAVVSLACAALLAPGTGGQILISELVEQIRADAAVAGVVLGEDRAGLRRVCAALELLVAWGVLEETHHTVEEWREHEEEALLTVNRPVLPYLLARRLPMEVGQLADLWDVPTVAQEARKSLRRRLVENPVVHREELSDAEQEVLYRDRSDLVRQLEESFGLSVEVRLEGAAAFDMDGDLSDVAFPGTGTVRQAALLLIDALLDAARPAAGRQADVGGRAVPGQACAWAAVDSALAELVDRYGKAWAADLVGDPVRLRREVVGLLESVSLARSTAESLVLHPAAARYRPEPHAAPRRTRAARRLSDDGMPDAVSQEEL